MSAPGESELAVRRTPVQERAQRRVAAILEAATGLLAEVGADGFTTRLVSERAGIPIGSIYQYFPNKLSIFAALLDRVTADVHERMREVLDADLDAVASWAELVDGVVDAYTASYASQVGYAALLPALRGTPELYAISQRSNEEALALFFQRVRRMDRELPDARLEEVGRTAFEILHTLLDRALTTSDPEQARIAVRELKRVLKGYLASYFGPPRAGFGE
ncbi:MAG: TetR/AcrR family transcriptional regulator [Myxococcota bacterium]|nr:TetR/AcrR family transcriptional regulator [Myxococcota bacterium]